MTMDPGVRAYVERAGAGPPIWEVTLEEARAGIEAETTEIFGPVDDVARIEDRVVEGVRVRIYRPEADGPLPALVYFHGGGWAVGSIESHDPVCRAISARAPAVVVSVDYRLAPEHCFPAGLEDAWAVTEWVSANLGELGADRVAVAGDSSGGNLAAVVALRARDRGVPLALQVLVYPVIDCDLDSPGYVTHGTGLNLTRAKMEWYWSKYMNGADPAQPEASPLRAADVGGVAPALVITAEYDPLCYEAAAYARRLEVAGVPVLLDHYEEQIHGFIRLAALTADADLALDRMARELSASAAGP